MEKLHVGCCVLCVCWQFTLSRRRRERQNVLASNMKRKKDGGWYILYTCVCVYNVDKPESGGVCDGWKKNYGQPAYAHTHMCVCGVETGMHFIYIYICDSCVTVNGFVSLLDSPSVCRERVCHAEEKRRAMGTGQLLMSVHSYIM